jgi:GNAT superfamily N-acetyltransferase
LEGLLFRTYQPADFDPVMKLHKLALLHANAYTGEGPWDDDLHNIENHYLNNGGWFVVGELHGAIVAMGAFRKINEDTAEIKRMRTLPSLQGNGIGRKILELLLHKIDDLNYRKVILETSDRQKAAEKLYTSYGFVPYAKENIRGLNCTWYQRGTR